MAHDNIDRTNFDDPKPADIGRRIYEIRRKKNIKSQLKFVNEIHRATGIEISKNSVSNIECGKYCPSARILYLMAHTLNCSIDDFFRDAK